MITESGEDVEKQSVLLPERRVLPAGTVSRQLGLLGHVGVCDLGYVGKIEAEREEDGKSRDSEVEELNSV